MTSIYPCSVCGERPPGKLASVFFAHYVLEGVREAYKQRLCAGCYIDRYAALFSSALDDPSLCPSCHTKWGDDLDAVYASVYLPKQAGAEVPLPLCGACCSMLWPLVKEGSVRLEDRERQVGGSQPPISSASIWDSLGLVPELRGKAQEEEHA